MAKRNRKRKRTGNPPKYTGILDPRVGVGTAVHRKHGKTSKTWEKYRNPHFLNEQVKTVVPPTISKSEKVAARPGISVIRLERPVTCKACGTGLDIGSRVKRYPNGVYGQECHDRNNKPSHH